MSDLGQSMATTISTKALFTHTQTPDSVRIHSLWTRTPVPIKGSPLIFPLCTKVPPQDLNQDMERDSNGTTRCVDATGMLYAILALNKLDEKIPLFSDAEAAEQAGRGGWAAQTLAAFDQIAMSFAVKDFAFSHNVDAFMWHNMIPGSARRLINDLHRTASNYYQTLDGEFNILFGMVKAFNDHVEEVQANGSSSATYTFAGMTRAIADRIKEPVHDTMKRMVQGLVGLTRFGGSEDKDKRCRTFVTEHGYQFANDMMSFAQYQLEDLILPGPSLVATDIHTEDMYHILSATVHEETKALVERLRAKGGESAVFADDVIADELKDFHWSIAKIFSYATPLLCQYWDDDRDSDEDDDEDDDEEDDDEEEQWE